MGLRSWLDSRLAQADLVNLSVIIIFAGLISGGVIAGAVNDDVRSSMAAPLEEMGPMQADVDLDRSEPDERKDDDIRDKDRDDEDDDRRGKYHGDDDKDDDEDDDGDEGKDDDEEDDG